LRRLKCSGCRGVTDDGVCVVLEDLANLELLDISNNWQVSHNIFTTITKLNPGFQALGIAKTNLAPIFVEQVANRVWELTGRFGSVHHQHPLEAVCYFKGADGDLDVSLRA
jgi:hypothetical protein